MKRRVERDIPVLFLKGSGELGRATGITAEKTHAKWRRAGLKYSVMDDGTFLYDPADVARFIKKYYAPQVVKEGLTL